MEKPAKYNRDCQINPYYVMYLEDKLKEVESVIKLTTRLVDDQSNGMTDGSICVSAMKDIRRHLR